MPTGIIPPPTSTPNQLDAKYILPKPKIAEKAVSESKGGPRVRDVLDHIIDLNSLIELHGFDETRKTILDRGDIFCYLLL